MLRKQWKLLGLLLVFSSAFADVVLPPPNSSIDAFYWPARLNLWALGGDRGVGRGDAMLPIVGNEWGDFYLDVQGEGASDDNWYGSVGAGYRQIYNDSRILGAYIFVDRNNFDNPHNTSDGVFWFVSPGLESLGNVWDFRVNGYIPVSSQRDKVGHVFADQIGFFNSVTFFGHTQFDTTFNIYNTTGPGIDGEIGLVRFPVRIYGGGYYFSPRDSRNITGISGRVEYPLNHYFALTASDSYDNVFHNNVEAGLRLTLDGISDDQNNSAGIQRRMLDPISRNLATVSQGTAEPILRNRRQIVTAAGMPEEAVERGNIYFFTSTGGVAFDPAIGNANCTFERPCTGISFNQTNVNLIAGFTPAANLFFNPGNYSFNGQLFLPQSQSMFGRNEGYAIPAAGGQRPIFVGSLAPLGNNILDSFQVFNDGSQPIGIVVNTNNILMNNLQIGQLNNVESFDTGVALTNAQNIIISNSTINGFREGAGEQLVTGISLIGAFNTLTLNNDQITVTANSTGGFAAAQGILVDTAILNVNNSGITVTSISDLGSGNSVGILAAVGSNQINLNTSNIVATNTATNIDSALMASPTAIGVNLASDGNILNVTGGSVSATVSGTTDTITQVIANAISASNNNQITIEGSTLSANATSSTSSVMGGLPTSNAITILLNGTGNLLNVNGSTINTTSVATAPGLSAANATSFGIDLNNGNTANVTNNVLNTTSNATGFNGISQSFGIDNFLNGSVLNESGNTFNQTASGSGGVAVSQGDIRT